MRDKEPPSEEPHPHALHNIKRHHPHEMTAARSETLLASRAWTTFSDPSGNLKVTPFSFSSWMLFLEVITDPHHVITMQLIMEDEVAITAP